MAKGNDAIIYGVILPLKDKNNPLIEYSFEDEQIKYTMTITVMASRRIFITNDTSRKTRSRLDKVRIVTEDQEIINNFITKDENGEMKILLEPYDVIMVRGNLSSIETKRTYTCPECGSKLEKEKGVVLYVDPVEIAKEKSIVLSAEEIAEIKKDTKEKMKKADVYPNAPDYEERVLELYSQKKADAFMKKIYQLLYEHREMSNHILIIGTVCKTPTYYTGRSEKTGTFCKCTIPLAVPRVRKIEYQEPERQADYIYVIDYDKNSQQHMEHLKIGSQILVTGAIQIREHKQQVFCPTCNKMEEVNSVDTEISAYRVEYLKNCIFTEEEEDY